MSSLDDLVVGAAVTGIDPAGSVSVVAAEWHGSQALTLAYRNSGGELQERMLFRADEGTFDVVEATVRAWSFDVDGHLFRLAAEARRIHLAHLLDPYMALISREVDPLPHQIEVALKAIGVENLSPVPGDPSYVSQHVVWTRPADVARRPPRNELAGVLDDSIDATTDLLVGPGISTQVLDLYR